MERYNLGTGQGTSVLELLRAAEAILGRPIPHEDRAPRPGDPAVLVADASKACRSLGWTPARSSPRKILDAAIRWHANGGLAICGTLRAA